MGAAARADERRSDGAHGNRPAFPRSFRHAFLPARDALNAAGAGRARRGFSLCASRGVGIVIDGGYNSGILATGTAPGASMTTPRFRHVCSSGSPRWRWSANATLSLGFGRAAVDYSGAVPGQVEQNSARFRRPSRPACRRIWKARSSNAAAEVTAATLAKPARRTKKEPGLASRL